MLTGLALLGASVPASAQTLTWSVVPSPNLLHNDHLEGVSCASAAGCTAVGYYRYTSGTLIESGTAGG